MSPNTRPSLSSAGGIRFEALQSLRGLACMAVVIRHVLACYPLHSHAATVATFFFFNSPAAVTIFFVLSGFVLGYSFEHRHSDRRHGLRAFWTRRVFRLLPALMAVTLLSLLYTRLPFSARPTPGADPFMAGILPHDLNTGLTGLVKCLLSLSSALVPQNWTVMVELIMAVFLPFIWMAVRRGGIALVLVAVVTFLLSAFAPGGGKGLPLLYSFSFTAGLCAWQAWLHSNIRLTTAGVVLAAIAVSLPTTLLTRPETLAQYFNAPRVVLPETIFAAFLVFGLARAASIGGLMESRLLLWLGDISFSLYLVHFLAISVAGRLLGPLLPGLADPWRQGLVLALTLLIGLPLSHLLFHRIERPFNRLGHRLAARW